MTQINWKAEALAFAKQHNSNQACVIQLLEKAMQHGAGIVASAASQQIKMSTLQLKMRRKANVIG